MPHLSISKKRRVIVLVLAVVGITTAVGQTSDTTPPRVTAFSFTPTTVDVSAGTQAVTVTATITDDLSGATFPSVFFQAATLGQTASAGLSRISGTNLDGTYQGSVQIPRFVVPGTWQATISVNDAAGNNRSLFPTQLQAAGFPVNLTVVDSVPDTAPPTLVSASFNPSSIDVSAADVPVTVTLHITDNLSGTTLSRFCYVITLAGPTGTPPRYVGAGGFQLISGTVIDGVWQTITKIPRYSHPGAWHIQSLFMGDLASNSINLSTSQLQAAGTDPVLTVASSPTDTLLPAVTGLLFSPTLFNTSLGSQPVSITISATDDLAGLDFGPSTSSCSNVFVSFTSPSHGQTVIVSPFTAPKALAGSPLAGTWQMSASWPRYSEEGTWSLASFSIKDAIGNQVNYTPAALASLGLPSTIVVTKPSLNVDGPVDSSGGTVIDNSFGARASVTFPPGVATAQTNVSIDVFPNPLSVPTPQGFTVPGTYFVNVNFSPALSSPLASPGIMVVLPLINPMKPGAHLSLYHIDPTSGQLAPALNATHNFAIGTVNADGLSATFLDVVTLSTVVAYISNGSTPGDVNGDGSVSCADASLVKAAFGKRLGQAGFNSAADLNSDTVIDIRDLFVVTRQLTTGTTCP